MDEKAFNVVNAIGTNERFVYEYDFGDSWEREITWSTWRAGRAAPYARPSAVD